jgi:hypothetical protein
MKYIGPFLVATVILLTACEKPPQAEIDAAMKAFDNSAKNPDVITYAPDSLRAAQEKLADLQAKLDAQGKKYALARRYETARSLAVEAKAAAEKALTDANRTKELARADAMTLIDGFPAAIAEFERNLWVAKRVRGIRLDPDILTLSDDTRAAAVDAEKDIASGAYAAAKAKAITIQQRLTEGESTITEAVRIAKGW